MKPLKSFLNKHPPNRRTSKLKEFEDEIRQLYNSGYQIQQIQQFLEGQKIETSCRNIYYFLENSKSVKNFSLRNPQETQTGEIDENEEIDFKNFRKLMKKT